MNDKIESYDYKEHRFQDKIPLWNRLSFKNRGKIVQYFYNFLLAIALFAIIFPLFWMVSTALRPDSQMYNTPVPIIPRSITLQNYVEVIYNTNIPLYYWNSAIVVIGVVLLTVVAATLGGYGLSRIDIPFRDSFARVILFGYMFPSILLSIPMFIFWRELGIINTRTGLILAETAKTLPFSLWLMWKFFDSIPYSLEESARVAGASRFRAFYEIALPRAKAGIVSIAILAFAVSWDEFTLAKVLMPDQENWVLTIGLTTLTQQQVTLWGEIMAASSLMLIPSFLFVYFLQEYMLQGMRT